MRAFITTMIIGMTAILTLGCGEAAAPDGTDKKEDVAKDKDKDKAEPVEDKVDWQADATKFLDKYLAEYAKLEKVHTLGYWKAANSGKKEDFDAAAAAELELKKLHSDKGHYEKIQELRKHEKDLEPLTARSLMVAELAFKGNQLSPEVLEELVKKSSEIEQIFNTFRAELNGEKQTNNDMLTALGKENKTAARQELWGGLKQVGGAVGPKLVELAKLRNKAAESLGYKNYWDMQIRLQELVMLSVVVTSGVITG